MSVRAANAISEAAIEAATPAYLAAVAAEIDGHHADDAWQRVAAIIGRAHVLINLEGIADAVRLVRMTGNGAADMFQRPEDPFESLEPGAFDEAIREFEGRVPRLAETARRLAAEGLERGGAIVAAERAGEAMRAMSASGLVARVMGGSFFVTGADKTTIVNLKALLAEAIRGGVSVDEAGKIIGVPLAEFVDRAQLAGAANLAKARLQTIYRTNLASAYNEAQGRVLEAPAVQPFVPLVMRTEIRDRRTRGNPSGLYPDAGFHWQMHGYVGTMDEFRQRGIVGPCGYSCRGGIRGVSRAEAARHGWVDDEGRLDTEAIARHNGARTAILDRGDFPDPGFLA